MDDTDYCRTQVETYDRDRYILSLAAPESLRPALWALYAFALELAKTKEITKDAAAGHLRLAWWRERIGGFYAGSAMPAHDVARALGHAIAAHDLPRDAFDALLDARALDMDKTILGSLEGLAAYADATNAPLVQLTAQILSVPAPEHLGKAWGLTGIIRALPWFAQQNRCVLPLPLMHDIGLMPEQFHHLGPSPALNAAVKSIAQEAADELAHVRTSAKLFRAQVKMCGLYLKKIEKSGHDPFALRPLPFLAIRVLLF